MSDVCLFLEGTYPYVSGGVSSCVYQLISKTPNTNYFIFYIGGTEQLKGEYRYPVPGNVKMIKEIFLYDYDLKSDLVSLGSDFDPHLIKNLHLSIQSDKTNLFSEVYEKFFDVDNRKFDPLKIFHSQEAWDFLVDVHNKNHGKNDSLPFIEYFYSWRFTHYPLFKLLSQEIPRAKVYHAMSTGYAGLIGAAASIKYEKPFVLTEHGIYAHEREIEISQAQWLYNTDKDLMARENMSFFKEWWIRMFHYFSKLTYERADVITTLYDGNRQKQIKHGASPRKIKIIPNGVNLESLSGLRPEAAPSSEEWTIALIGRVVPIKDIKTFIKSISILNQESKGKRKIKALIMGPTEEDETYFEECNQLVRILNLVDVIEFTGKVQLKDYIPKIDLMVLSSISEGQPLVILESYTAGIPVVATDVGSCSELIHGSGDTDKELGESGALVPFGRPDLMAKAMSYVLEDPKRYKEFSDTAKKRVRTFYNEKDIMKKYINIYSKYIAER